MRLLLLFAVLPCYLAAQNPGWLNFTRINDFRDIAVSDSMIWVATDGGLLCYNKQTGAADLLTRANGNLPINELYSVACTPDGSLWIGTPIGVARQENGSWHLINPTPAEPTCGPWTYGLKVRNDGKNGIWWLGVKGYLWHFDGHSWTAYNPEVTFGVERIVDFEVRPDGKLWVFADDHQNETFYLFDGTTAMNWGFSDQLPNLPGANKVHDWTMDHEGKLWFSSGNWLGVPNTAGSWTLEPLNNLWPVQICADANNEIWAIYYGKLYHRQSGGSWVSPALPYIPMEYDDPFSTDTDGRPLFFDARRFLLHFNDTGLDTLRYATHDIPYNSVVELIVTGEQTIWAAVAEQLTIGWLNGQSLARFSDGKWTTFPQNISDSVYIPAYRDIKASADGTVWAAGIDKLLRFNGSWWDVFQVPELPWGQVLSLGIHPSGSTLWLGGNDAIARFDVSAKQATTFVPPAWADMSQVANIEVDFTGNVWVAAFHETEYQGMLRFDGADWKFFSCTDMKLEPYSMIHDFTIGPDGRLWVLSDLGVAVFDGNSWSKFSKGFPYLGEYLSIAFDGDAVWLGCYRSTCFTPDIKLALLKVENGFITYYPYSEYPLPYPNITALAVDGYHNLWIGGEKGGIAVMREDGVILGAPGLQTPAPVVSASLTPNPAGQYVRLQYEAPSGGQARFDLLDFQGKILFSTQWTVITAEGRQEQLLQLPAMPAGIYAWQLTRAGIGSSGKIILTGN